MDFAHLGLHTQAFHEQGKPSVFVHYLSQQSAYDFLYGVLKSRRGIGLLYGPESSGKSTLIRQFVRCLPADLAVAVIDGARMEPQAFLETVLTQFRYDVAFSSSAHWLDMLIVFVVQQTRSNQAPLLVIENFDQMDPGALRVLCQLAELRLDQRIALRLILVSTHAPYAIVHAPAMSAVENRMPDAFELGPMTEKETVRYLHAKLRTGGAVEPARLMPEKICREIYQSSKGWPGEADRLAEFALLQLGKAAMPVGQAESAGEPTSPVVHPPIEAFDDEPPLLVPPPQVKVAEDEPEPLAQPPQVEVAEDQPAPLAQPPQIATVEVEPALLAQLPGNESAEAESVPLAQPPAIAAVEDSTEPGMHKLFVTMNGKTLQEFEMTGSKVLIGRSALCDLCINSRFISKFHAMLIRNNQEMYLVDLHSSNGTFVNSQRVQTKALRHDDVISLGNHGIKLISPAIRIRPEVAGHDLAETSTMKTLDDLRRARAQQDELAAAIQARD